MELKGFPPGFCFLPSPEQCIFYLKRKVTYPPLPFHALFLDLDPYNLKHLPQIFSSAEKKGEVYTFTKLHRKGKIGNTNANRRVGNATWHVDNTFEIPNENGAAHIGMYHKLSYREKGSQYDHQFVMTEYTLSKGTFLQYDPLKDYVLCHIVKKGWSHNDKKVSKSKRSTTNHHQVAAVFQPVSIAAADVSFYGVENPSTSYSYHSSEVETPTYFQPVYNDAPSMDGSFSALEHDQDNLLEILMSLDYESKCPTLDDSFFFEDLK